MANLLTVEQKKQNRRERKLRIAVVVLWFVLGMIFIAGVFLVPSYLIVSGKQQSTQEQLDVISELIENRQGNDAQQIVQETRTQLDLLSEIIDGPHVLHSLETILGNVGSAVVLSNITYARISSTEVSMQLSGVASNRNELLSFKKRLEQEKNIVSADLPVSDLAQSADIPFSITLSLLYNDL